MYKITILILCAVTVLLQTGEVNKGSFIILGGIFILSSLILYRFIRLIIKQKK